jgi:hypothetical protein
VIIGYPSPYAGSPPYYLVTGDKAFVLADYESVHNFNRVGVPLVPFTVDDITWILGRLAPGVEHALSWLG